MIENLTHTQDFMLMVSKSKSIGNGLTESCKVHLDKNEDHVDYVSSNNKRLSQKKHEQEQSLRVDDNNSITDKNSEDNLDDGNITTRVSSPPSMLPYPIHSIAARGDLSELKWAVEMNRKYFDTHKEAHFKFDIDVRNRHGMTALHGACYYGRFDVVKWLVLRMGADVNALSRVNVLSLSRNSDFNHGEHSPHVSQRLFASCLHYSSANGHKVIVQFLIENGADCNQLDYKGHTALQVARMNNHKKTASLLENHMIKQRETSILYIGSGGTDAAIVAKQQATSGEMRRTATMPKISSSKSASPLRVQVSEITRNSADNLVSHENTCENVSTSSENDQRSHGQLLPAVFSPQKSANLANSSKESPMVEFTSNFMKLVHRMSGIKLFGETKKIKDNKES